MNTLPASESDSQSIYCGILARTQRAFQLAQFAAGTLANGLAVNSGTAYVEGDDAEKQLDELDCVIDAAITEAIAQVTPSQGRELLACIKFLIDLERIGDLLVSASNCAQALGDGVGMDDLNDLVKMSSLLERMVADAHRAFWVREVEPALAVLRADSEVDRLRNLMWMRHLEEAQARVVQNSIQILFMAQALERAGDHVKNLAEEVCHLVSGHSIRHLRRLHDKPCEQMYLEHLREQHLLNPAQPTCPTVQD